MTPMLSNNLISRLDPGFDRMNSSFSSYATNISYGSNPPSNEHTDLVTEAMLEQYLSNYKPATSSVEWILSIVTIILCTYFLIGAAKKLVDEQYFDALKGFSVALVVSIGTKILSSLFF